MWSATPILLAVVLFSSGSGVNIVGPQGYIPCPCSPSKRGYRTSALEEVQNVVRQISEDVTGWKRERIPAVEITRRATKEAKQGWESCVNNFSGEECANADAALRLGGCQPKCASICFFNAGTWRNVASGGTLTSSCDAVAKWKSTDQELLAGPVPGGEVRVSAVNPRPGPAGRVTPPPAPAAPTGNAGSGSGGSAEPVSGGDLNGVPITRNNTEEPPPTRRGEGCVAVEHLRGYVLQHSSSLMRPVLCGRGFCATPNHGIIVDGELTSMKKLCAGKWTCVQSVKLVNNLKLAANRRAIVNQFITVTPYDIRFPKWAIWAVQILEDLRDLVAFSVAVAGVAALGVLVGSKVLV